MTTEHINRKGTDPYPRAIFGIEIDGFTTNSFDTCDIPEKEFGVMKHRFGDSGKHYSKQRSPIENVGTIVLGRGIISVESDLHLWYQLGDRRDVFIIQLDRNQNEVHRWKVLNCFPIRNAPNKEGWESSDEEGLTIEELEIEAEDVLPVV